MESSDLTRRALLAVSGASGLTLATMTSARGADGLKGRELSVDEAETFKNHMKECHSCRLLPRTVDGTKASAEVNGGIVNNTFFLTVAGKKPYLNMKVVLSPLIYTKQPEYWEIEVIGCASGIVLPAIGCYNETIPIDAYRGKKGIEVVWADDRYRIEVPTKS